MRTVAVMSSLVVLTMFGCSGAERASSAIDLEGERTALLEADRAWSEAQAASDSPTDVVMAQFLADAYLLAPDAPLLGGTEAIREVFAGLEAMPGYSLAWEPTVAEVGGAGDLGYTIGSYEMKMAPEGAPITIVGKYMTVWKKQADGTWKVAVDMFNANGPPVADEE